MGIESYFFDAIKGEDGSYDRTYKSEDFANYLRKIVSNGVFINPSNNLQVIANGTMGALLKEGEGWINGHKMVMDSDLRIGFNPSDVVLNRIDRVVFYCDYLQRSCGIEIKQGENGTTFPKVPPLQRDETRYELSLATVRINKQATTISQRDITDERGNSDVCGWVISLIQQLDSKTFFLQWQKAYEDAIKNDQGSFDSWFDDVKEKLSTATLLRQFNATYITKGTLESIIPINIPQFNQTIDVLNVYINGLKLIKKLEYTVSGDNKNVVLTGALDIVGTPVDFEVLKSVDGSNAETIVQMVEDLQVDVNTLKNEVATLKKTTDDVFKYTYTCGDSTGDNIKISNVIKDFCTAKGGFFGTNNYSQLCLEVIGKPIINGYATTTPSKVILDLSNTSTTRRVTVDFGNCATFVTTSTGDNTTMALCTGSTIKYLSLQGSASSTSTQLTGVKGDNARLRDCDIRLTGEKLIIGFSGTGVLEDTNINVRSESGSTQGVSVGNAITRITNCNITAYRKSTATGATSTGVYVAGANTKAFLMATNNQISPVEGSGYSRDNGISVSAGKYILLGNATVKASVKANGTTGEELATVIV